MELENLGAGRHERLASGFAARVRQVLRTIVARLRFQDWVIMKVKQ
jgi:hypothetical protein